MSDLDPTSFRSLIDRILEPARRHLRRVFLPVAGPLTACGVVVTLAQMAWFGALWGGGDLGPVLPVVGGVFLLIAGVLATYVLTFSALLVASLDAVAQRPVAMGRAWLFALQPRVFGTLVVVAVLCGLSLVMCLVPALYVIPVLAFVLPAMVEENLYGWAAIRRSSELAHYNPTGRWTDSAWLQTFVLIAVGTVINFAISLTVELPFVAAQQVLVLRDAVAGGSADPAALLASTLWLQIPAQVASALATTVTWLYWSFGISLLYREIRRRKEGADLRQAIDELTGAAGGDPVPQAVA